MSTELKAKLEAKRITRKAIFDDIESLRANEAKADKEIADLEKQIADEAKPERRLGDYGHWKGSPESTYIVVLNCNNKFEYQWHRCKEPEKVTAYGDEYFILLGNIFDDLKAMQETVTEFEMNMAHTNDVKAYWSGNSLCFKQGYDYFYIPQKKLPAFILKIRQMEATLKRDK